MDIPMSIARSGCPFCNVILSQKAGHSDDILTIIYERRDNMSVVTLTRDNFQSEVMKSDKPVLIDFWASWCGPCRMVSPVIDEIAGEVSHVKVGKVNVDEQPQLAAQFGVMSIPTLVVIRDGKVVNQTVGVRPKTEILNMLNS